MATEVHLHYSDPLERIPKTYSPPKELPFESKGSYREDKKEWQKTRETFYRMSEGLRKEGVTEKAEEDKRDYLKLDKLFGLRDSLTIMADNKRMKKK
jgi:hypothetical protein